MRRVALQLVVLCVAAALSASAGAQTVSDPNLVVETYASGLSLPTTLAFVDKSDLLVLQKADGLVKRVLGGVVQPIEALDVNVNATSERGLLGIAVNPEDSTDVFLYFTESSGGDGGTAIANRVYRYVWDPVAGKLLSPTLILDLPVVPGPNHNGGVMLADVDLLYIVIGDLNRNGQLQNFPAGDPPDDTGVILRTTFAGQQFFQNPFQGYCSLTTGTNCWIDETCPTGETCRSEVARYFAYGVRNSFGMALDPVTGALWNTENGPGSYDEINRVTPGMNSGWEKIMGPDALDPEDPNDLFDMPGAGSTYSDPEFSWFDTTAPTSIVFPAGGKLGDDYHSVALVGDSNSGQIYRFPLDGARTGFDFSAFPALQDLVANDNLERDLLIWGQGFGTVTDLRIGPDGDLYVVSLSAGEIYRISNPPSVPIFPH